MRSIIMFLFITLSSLFGKNIVFYYEDRPIPEAILYSSDYLIVDPNNSYVDKILTNFTYKKRAKIIGYISLGELEKFRKYYSKLKKFKIGENKEWNSEIADVTKKEYTDFLINVVAKNMVKRGFDGFFIDTMDSYKLIAKPNEYKKFEDAETEFIKKLKKTYPNKEIIVNRPFDIIDRIYKYINYFVVENIFYDNHGNETTAEYKKFLFPLIEKVQSYNIPIVAIEYVKDLNNTDKLAKKLKKLGLIPYITKDLHHFGRGENVTIPRRILLIYDPELHSPVRQFLSVHRLVQMPLNYLGFAADIVNVKKTLPEPSKFAGYTGIVIYNFDKMDNRLKKWIFEAKKNGLKIFFFETIPTDEDFLKEFGFKVEDVVDNNFKVIYKDKNIGFEFTPVLNQIQKVYHAKTTKNIIVVKNKKGQKSIEFALTKWGGFAFDGSLISQNELWSYDPFKLFKKIFDNNFPIPDNTTETGKRILTSHVDGDAFTGKTDYPPYKILGEVIRDKIFKKYKIPVAASVIVGEIVPNGLHPKESKKLIEIAKSIFKLPYVEPGSHTYSHPFDWQLEYANKKDLEYGYHLNIPNYKFSFKNEIYLSVKFINKLTPKKVILLWSGNCNPNEKQLGYTYDLKIYNVNGGDTYISKNNPFLNSIGPFGVNYGYYYQVYAPITNENIFTNLWTYPKWGFRNVIQTFEMTEKPRRIKPIGIYYHYYSGQTYASLNALKKVYDYALKQDVTPLFLSEFAKKVLDTRYTSVFRTKDGFIIKNNGDVHTLRIDKKLGYVDIYKSKGVIGFKDMGKYYYLNLDNSGFYKLVMRKIAPKNQFYLISSNGVVKEFKKDNGIIEFVIKSYIKPLKIELNIPKNVKVYINGKQTTKKDNIIKGSYAKIRALY